MAKYLIRLLSGLVILIALFSTWATFRELSSLIAIGSDYQIIGSREIYVDGESKSSSLVILGNGERSVLISSEAPDDRLGGGHLSRTQRWNAQVKKLWGESLPVYEFFGQKWIFMFKRIAVVGFLFIFGIVLWQAGRSINDYNWKADTRDLGGDGGL